MTAIPPIENRRVVGLKDGQIKLLRKLLLNPVCAHPECDKKTDDGHHIWARAQIANDSWIVEISEDDGSKQTLFHVTGLCREHHDAVERHDSWIRYEEGEFNWYERIVFENDKDQLDGQWAFRGALSPQPGEVQHPKKTKALKKTAPKDTKQINLAAPTEEMEAFLTLLQECRVLLERPETTRWKFYTMLEVLTIFLRDATKEQS